MIPSCPPPPVPPSYFEAVEPHAPLVIEVRSVNEELLGALERRGLTATLVLTLEEAPLGVEAAMRGHELALDLDPELDPEQLADWRMESWWDLVRDQQKAFRKATGVKPTVIRVEGLTRQAELAMSQAGLTTVLVDQPGRPHLAATMDGTRGKTLVLPLGDYACQELHHGALDAIAEASEKGTALGLPAVRVMVDEQPTELFLEWLDEGWLRVGGPVILAGSVPHALPDPSARRIIPGRKLDRSDLVLAASGVAEGGRLPRTSQDLTLTELYLGLVLLLAEDAEEVSLTSLGPPVSAARSTGVSSVAADDVRAAAARLAPALTTAIPGFVDVGPAQLTAGEFLVVMARVALNPQAERVDVPKVESPDPYADGLGWGVAP